MSMQEFSLQVGNEQLTFRTGGFARQAGGAVMVQYGETVVFVAATAGAPRAGIDYFPLMVDYRERTAAAGRFPGGYFKREGRPSDRETLIARMTDRPIRPLFPDGFRNEVQVVAMLLSADGKNESDVLTINGASAALVVSSIPFAEPIGAVRIGIIGGECIVNPPYPDLEESRLDLIYVGTRDKVVMIEGSAHEVTEAALLEAIDVARKEVTRIVEIQEQMRRAVGKPPMEYEPVLPDPALVARIESLLGDRMRQALLAPAKQERYAAMDALRTEAGQALMTDEEVADTDVGHAFEEVEKRVFRAYVLQTGKRVDGRGLRDLRPLQATVGLLPRTHGSALFTRGETQALALTTLGSHSDTQDLDALTGGIDEKRFMLHYNFPHFSVGEVGMIRGPGRRDIGHGALAERSVVAVLPKDFPYTVRVNSEILESNGSSSMATVCAATLALMDAGVPIASPVAGVSVGLVTGDGKELPLTDILGLEDHLGDMDFKVAGTAQGITGFQLDLKLRGVSREIIAAALEQAREARSQVIDAILQTLPAPRTELSAHAPRIRKLSIDPEKIGLLIGPQGKNIRRITETTGVSIDVEDNGDVFVFSNNAAGMEAAVAEIELMTADVELGKIYHGKVVSVKEFGAFVELLPGKDGLCHISELADFRVRRTEDVANIGDEIWVKVIDVDERGRVRLSRRVAMAERGETETPPPDLDQGSPRDDRPAQRQDRPEQSSGHPRRDDHDGGRDPSRRPPVRRRRPS